MVKNITARVYPPGGAIDVVILLVANHMGTFTFSLCPRDSFDVIGKLRFSLSLPFFLTLLCCRKRGMFHTFVGEREGELHTVEPP